jgi:hypothetical protein
MAKDVIRHNRPVFHGLHPNVYKTIVGLTLLFILAVWLSFGAGGGYIDVVRVVVSGLFFVAAMIPTLIWLTARRHPDPERLHDEQKCDDPVSFREWWSGDIDTGNGRRKTSDAALEILLPIAAAAFGMVAIGIVFHLAAVGSA